MRPLALALSPDGRLLVTAGLSHELVVVNPVPGQIEQHVPLPADDDTSNRPGGAVSEVVLDPDLKAQMSFTGLAFSPNGSRIYLANVNGDIKVFGVNPDHAVKGLFSISLPPANTPRRKAEIPAGITVSHDGKRLYVALNLSNRLAELDAATGKVAGAKNPRKRGNLFDFRAAHVQPPQAGSGLPAVRLTFPDGTVVTSEQPDLPQILSEVLGREVGLAQAQEQRDGGPVPLQIRNVNCDLRLGD